MEFGHLCFLSLKFCLALIPLPLSTIFLCNLSMNCYGLVSTYLSRVISNCSFFCNSVQGRSIPFQFFFQRNTSPFILQQKNRLFPSGPFSAYISCKKIMHYILSTLKIHDIESPTTINGTTFQNRT